MMANSDHEDFEVSTSPPSLADGSFWTEQGPAKWKTQPLREFRRRRYTMSHVSPPPPAPPSTPTLLTSNASASASVESTSPIPANANATAMAGTAAAAAVSDSNRFNQFFYVTSSKNLHRDSRCSEAELAELFNVVTITNRLATNGASGSSSSTSTSVRHRTSRHLADRGIRNASRTISKLNGATKIFKIHRNPKEFLREPDEDSVSAPEYDTEEEDRTRRRRFWRCKSTSGVWRTQRERKFARFEHQERMETIVDSFDAAMSFNEA